MGPRLVSRGKWTGDVDCTARCNASMGPRLVSRGKAIDELKLPVTFAGLQWGRDLLVAESYG